MKRERLQTLNCKIFSVRILEMHLREKESWTNRQHFLLISFQLLEV